MVRRRDNQYLLQEALGLKPRSGSKKSWVWWNSIWTWKGHHLPKFSGFYFIWNTSKLPAILLAIFYSLTVCDASSNKLDFLDGFPHGFPPRSVKLSPTVCQMTPLTTCHADAAPVEKILRWNCLLTDTSGGTPWRGEIGHGLLKYS